MTTILVLIRALTFASCFVGLWIWAALAFRRRFETFIDLTVPIEATAPGLLLMLIGGALGLACILSFVFLGHGTPAPFDAPRKFVVWGPYRFVRNPMYIGGFLAWIGFGLYMQSAAIGVFGIPWILLGHLFVVLYEEPALRRQFADEYETYCRQVNRWIPKRPNPGH